MGELEGAKRCHRKMAVFTVLKAEENEQKLYDIFIFLAAIYQSFNFDKTMASYYILTSFILIIPKV